VDFLRGGEIVLNSTSLNKTSFTKNMLIIAVPIMVQSLITASVNLIDTIMIGKLGESAIASLGITNQMFMLFSILAMGIFTGVGVLISQYWGRKDIARIRAFTSLQVKLGIGLALIFVLIGGLIPERFMSLFTSDSSVIDLGASYLRLVIIGYIPFAISGGFGVASRSIGKTVIPMIASVSALLINVVLNYGLIYGNLGMPELGVRGAAIATSIARITEMLVILISVYSFDKTLALRIKELIVWNSRAFKEVFVPMSQVVLNDLCWALGMIVYTMLYGRIGTGAIASIQIMTTIQQLFMIAIVAISSAACVMVGGLVGEGSYEEAISASWYFLKVVFAVSIILSFFVGFGTESIMSFFNVSQGVAESSKLLLFITAVIMPVRGLEILFIIGILRGGGDAKGALKIEMFTMWVIGVPLCYVGAVIFKWNVEIVYLLVATEEFAKLALSYTRFKKGKWINNFTEKNEMIEAA